MREKQAGFPETLLRIFGGKSAENIHKPITGALAGMPAAEQFAASAPKEGPLKSLANLLKKLDTANPQSMERFVGQLAGTGGREAGREAVQEVRREIGPVIEEAMEKGKARATAWGREAFKKSRKAARTTGLLGLVGGAAGAAAGAPQGEHRKGMSRGIVGGLAGAAATAAMVPKKVGLGGKGMLPLLGGALLGGSLAGYTTRSKQPTKKPKKKEASMLEGHKLAGVTFDWYDDHGETLKSMFPTPDELPDMIKTANVPAKEKLPNEAFALIMLDQGHVFRKYACADPGTTAMSVIYFMEHGDKLPEDAQKMAASNLVEACVAHDIMPPATMTKVAEMQFSDAAPALLAGIGGAGGYIAAKGEGLPLKARAALGLGGAALGALGGEAIRRGAKEKTAVVDVTGKQPEAKVIVLRPVDEDDYCVKLADGSLHYPIDNWDRVKQAEAYFQDERIRMDPELRRQYAVKLARKSYIVGYPLDPNIVELGALSYHNDGHLKHACEMRKAAFESKSPEHEFLDELFEKRASIPPETYAECLKRFDMMNELDRGWDHVILDPWASTFGVKTASIVWEQGAERVTEEELVNLARNDPNLVKAQFSTDFLDQFQKDPVGIFNSMPDPQKKLLSRMAADAASSGGSEFMPTAAPEQGGGGHKKSLA
jgi:hypothetical protein